MATIKRAKLSRADLAVWDGVNATYSRANAAGGTTTGLAVGNEVDVLQVFGGGTDRTYATMLAAKNFIASTNCTIVFAPGTWTVDTSITFPSTCNIRIPAGCVFAISTGITLTFSGNVYNESATFYSGAGTLAATSIHGPLRTAAEIAAGVTPSAYSFTADTPYYDARRSGATIGGLSAANTTAIQSALNGMNGTTTAGGGIVYVPKGVSFTLTSITFPARGVLLYYGGDDTSDSSIVGTNELRWFVANANADGIVNENRLESSFHPGHMINVRKNVSGHDAYLVGAQSRTNPARASYNIDDEAVGGRWRVVYENYNTYSALSGWRMHSFVRRITLAGINTGSFVTDPVVGDLITGSTSGAKGFVISIDGTNTVVAWITGVFVVGETVTDPNETSSTTISSVTISLLEAHSICQDNHRGYIGFGVPGGECYDLATFGGAIALTPTRTMGQYIPTTITNPILKWLDVASSTANGLCVEYDVNPSAAARRLFIKRQTSGAVGANPLGMVGAVTAKTAFSNTALEDQSRINVTANARTGTGVYTVTLTNALVTADPAVAIGNNNIADFSRYEITSSSVITIRNYDNTWAPADLVGQVSVAVVGGDI